MKTASKKINVLLTLICLAGLSFLVYLKISLQKDLDFIIQTKQENAIIRQKISSTDNLQKKIDEVEAVNAAFKKIFLDRGQILNFIETVEMLASQNRLSLNVESVDLDEAHLSDQPVSYGALEMVVSLRGNLSGLENFVFDLENLPRHITFNNIRLVEAGSQPGEWSAHLSFEVITN